MERNNKWSMFRNFMFNELGITKEDIQEWIKEAVKEEAERLVNRGFSPEKVVHNMIWDQGMLWGTNLRKEILETIKEEVKNNFNIKVTYKEND